LSFYPAVWTVDCSATAFRSTRCPSITNLSKGERNELATFTSLLIKIMVARMSKEFNSIKQGLTMVDLIA